MPRLTFKTKKYNTIELEYILTNHNGYKMFTMRDNQTDEYYGLFSTHNPSVVTAEMVEEQIDNYRKNLFCNA